MSVTDAAPEIEAKQQSALRRLTRWMRRTTLLVLGPAVVAVGALYVYVTSGRFVTTENAYVKTELIIVTPEVSGVVSEVEIDENQRVSAGDILFRIAPERFIADRDRLKAELLAARQRVDGLKARHRARRAELVAAKQDADFFKDEMERAEALWANRNISETRVSAARREATQADRKVDIAEEEIAAVLAELNGDPTLPTARHPDVMRAQAELTRAELDLAATTLRAPSDAIAANLRLQPGEYVEEGDPVLSLVSTDGFWVEANLKETDLTHLREGHPASLSIDAYPDVTWRAHVASLSPATGAEYAVLPPQNASGNWVKVVQRIPVRLEITPQDGAPPLRAGMSVAVSIDTGYERPLPDVLNSARAWIAPPAPVADQQ